MANARALLAGAALLACAVVATFFYGYVRQNQVDVALVHNSDRGR